MPPEMFHTRLLDNLTTAILLVDAGMRVIYLNPAAEGLLELSSARIVGEEIERVLQEDSDTAASLQRVLETGVGFTKRQATLHLGVGKEMTVDYVVTPVTLESEALIIEIQPLDRLMRISREEAILSAQHLSQLLVRSLAHEIKNPLGGLRGAAQLLARELASEQLTDYTNVIIEEAWDEVERAKARCSLLGGTLYVGKGFDTTWVLVGAILGAIVLIGTALFLVRRHQETLMVIVVMLVTEIVKLGFSLGLEIGDIVTDVRAQTTRSRAHLRTLVSVHTCAQ